MKEEAVIRQQVRVEMKITGKTGEQKKDQGILYLRSSLKGDQHSEYLSYVRGKSNIVQVFDTKTENVLFQKQYDKLEVPIKGLETVGSDIFEMRHIIVDEKGKLFVDKAAVQAG